MHKRGRIDRRFIVRIAAYAVAALYFGMLVLFLFLPFPRVVGRARNVKYTVDWADGSRTEESFTVLYPDLVGLKDGKALIVRDGAEGTAEAFGIVETERVLRDGSLLELQCLDMGAVDRLTQFAIVRAYARTVWLTDGETFAITAAGFKPLNATVADTVVLMSGSVSAEKLRAYGAKELWLHGEAEFSYKTLLGTTVGRVRAWAPYSERGGAVYLQTPSGLRLLAAVPAAKELKITGNSYADRGSLLPCMDLERLSLDFVGNTASPIGSEFDGLLAYLFSDGKEYFVPETLASLKVTGGVLVSNAFYRCESLEEIDACGMDADMISRNAFAGLTLRSLHTPNPDVILLGGYMYEELPCGCTLYTAVS